MGLISGYVLLLGIISAGTALARGLVRAGTHLHSGSRRGALKELCVGLFTPLVTAFGQLRLLCAELAQAGTTPTPPSADATAMPAQRYARPHRATVMATSAADNGAAS